MKIFYCFLIILVSAVLWLLPVTDGIYAFRTDVKQDTYYIQTDGATTTGNVTLLKSVYQGDTTTISLSSDLYTDSPALVNYNTTNRKLDLNGLSISSNRTLTVSYDYDALSASSAISNFMDKLAWIWLICIAVFPIAGITFLFINKKD